MFSLIFLLTLSIDTKVLSERIEARVGKEIITSTDLNARVEALKSNEVTADLKDLRKKALESLIDQALVNQFLSSQGLSISEKDVDLRIQSIRSSNGATSDAEFRMMLRSQGLSWEEFRTQVRNQLEQAQFFGAMRRQSSKTIEENDLKAFYKANDSDFANAFEVTLRECVIPYGFDVKKTEATAMSFVKNPKNFSKCVKDLSISPTARSNGELGTFRKNSLRKDVEAKVFAVNAGEVVAVPMARGIQLLKVEAKKNLGRQSFESVKNEIRQVLENELIEKEVQKTLSELRSKTFIQIQT